MGVRRVRGHRSARVLGLLLLGVAVLLLATPLLAFSDDEETELFPEIEEVPGSETDNGVSFDTPFFGEISSFLLDSVLDCLTGQEIPASELSTDFTFAAGASMPYGLGDLVAVTISVDGYQSAVVTEFRVVTIPLFLINLNLLVPSEPDLCLYPASSVADTAIELLSPQHEEPVNGATAWLSWRPVDVPGVTYNVVIWPLFAFVGEQFVDMLEGLDPASGPIRAVAPDYAYVHIAAGLDSTSVWLEDFDTPVLPGMEYVWQVEAFDASGMSLGTSEVRSFEVLEESPAVETNEDASICAEETACDSPVEIATTLEWRDTILDDDFPADEVLADYVHRLAVKLSPPCCIPSVCKKPNKSSDKCSGWSKKRSEGHIVPKVRPETEDKNPQPDDAYASKTIAVYAGNCVCIRSYSFYFDSPRPEDDEIWEALTGAVEAMLETYLANSVSPWFTPEVSQKLGLPKAEASEKILEKAMEGISKLLDIDDATLDRAAADLKAKYPAYSKWYDAYIGVLRVLRTGDCGVVASIWEICGSYVPCATCQMTVKAKNASVLGDTDHALTRTWSVGSESGKHRKTGEDH